MRRLITRLEPETAEVACTLAATDQLRQRAEFGEIGRSALVGVERGERSLTLRFRAGNEVEARLRDLVAREHACCSFASYALHLEDDELRLDLSVPEFGDVFLDEIETAVTGGEAGDSSSPEDTGRGGCDCC